MKINALGQNYLFANQKYPFKNEKPSAPSAQNQPNSQRINKAALTSFLIGLTGLLATVLYFISKKK